MSALCTQVQALTKPLGADPPVVAGVWQRLHQVGGDYAEYPKEYPKITPEPYPVENPKTYATEMDVGFVMQMLRQSCTAVAPVLGRCGAPPCSLEHSPVAPAPARPAQRRCHQEIPTQAQGILPRYSRGTQGILKGYHASAYAYSLACAGADPLPSDRPSAAAHLGAALARLGEYPASTPRVAPRVALRSARVETLESYPSRVRRARA
jgi:hypothetical protein